VLRAQLDAAGRIVDANCFSIAHLLVRNDTDIEIIIGTINQIYVNMIANGTVQLYLDQDLAPWSNVTFAGLNLTTTPLSLASGGTGSNAAPLVGLRLIQSNAGGTAMVESTIALSALITTSTLFAGGDLTGTAPALTLVPFGPGASTWGNTTAWPVVTTDTKGRISGMSIQPIVGYANQVVIVPGGSVGVPTVIKLPQDLAPTSWPTFLDVNCTSFAGGYLLYSSDKTIVESTLRIVDVLTPVTAIGAGGDLTGTYGTPLLVAITTAGTVGPYAVWTRDTKGRVTSAANWTLAAGTGLSVNTVGTTTTFAVNTAGVSLAGDVTGTLAATTLATITTAQSVGPYLSISYNAKGLVTSATNWTLAAGTGLTVATVGTTTTFAVNTAALSLTGDVTGTLAATTLATITTAGTFGPYAIWTRDAKGRVTSATNYSLVGGSSISVSTSGTTTTVALASNVSFVTPNMTCLSTGVTVPAATTADFQIDCNTPDGGWIDIPIQPTVKGTGGNDPVYNVWRSPQRAYEFTGASSDLREIFGQLHVPHTIKPGTGIYFHVHWVPSAASPSGNIVWKFDYSYAGPGNNQVFPASTTVTATATMPAQYTHMITEIAAPVLAGSLEVDGVISIRVYRDAADAGDTSTNSAFLLFIDTHIQVSKFATKNRNKAGGSFYA
jgi:hypothetical protein